MLEAHESIAARASAMLEAHESIAARASAMLEAHENIAARASAMLEAHESVAARASDVLCSNRTKTTETRAFVHLTVIAETAKASIAKQVESIRSSHTLDNERKLREICFNDVTAPNSYQHCYTQQPPVHVTVLSVTQLWSYRTRALA